MTKKRLIDRVMVAIAARPKKAMTWFDRISPDEQAELLAIKKAWKSGEIVSSLDALAKDIIQQCREVGIVTCERQGMRTWLSRD